MNVYVATGKYVMVPAGKTLPASVQCDAGDVATGGSHYHMRGALVHPSSSFPVTDGTTPVGWTVIFTNESADEESFMVPMAICLDTTP